MELTKEDVLENMIMWWNVFAALQIENGVLADVAWSNYRHWNTVYNGFGE
jgi:hypothetical protein